MKLYKFSIAPNPLKVQMFLSEKKIIVDTVEINIRKKENLSSDYLKINPKGTLPCLKLNDGTLITESSAICKYFDETYPIPNLLGNNAKEKSIIEMWCRKIDNEGFNPVEDALRNSTERFKDRAIPGIIAAKQIPDLSKRGFMLINMFLDNCESQLRNNDFICGNKFTIADIYLYVLIYFCNWINISLGLKNKEIKFWHNQISKRESTKVFNF